MMKGVGASVLATCGTLVVYLAFFNLTLDKDSKVTILSTVPVLLITGSMAKGACKNTVFVVKI